MATALEYALGYSDPAVVGALELPWPVGVQVADGGLVVLLAGLWGDAMYAKSKRSSKSARSEVPVPVPEAPIVWHLPEEISITVPASYHGPMVDLWYDLLSWSSSSMRISIGVLASGVPRYTLVLNINNPSTLTACYEASTIPVSDFPHLHDIMGNSELSWATAPTICIINRAPSGMMTPSQFWRRYSPSKVIEYPGDDVAFSACMNLDIELAELLSTQSPNTAAQPSTTPANHESHQD